MTCKSTLVNLLAFFIVAKSAIDPSRVILVDNVGQNLLFRTNLPIDDNGDFQYQVLIDNMKNKTLEANLTFPAEFTFEVYTLLNIFEYPDLAAEEKFFKENPQLGTLTQYSIMGGFVYANELPQLLRKIFAQTYTEWSWDQLQHFAPMLRQRLESQTDGVKIIFFHCEAGEDRTGEVYGAYQMYNKGWTYQQALDFDNHVESRKIKAMSRNGLNWFCWYMFYTYGEGGDCTYEPTY